MPYLVLAALPHLPRAKLGEGPWWDVLTQRLYWVDIAGHCLHRYEPASGVCETHHTGTTTGFVVLDTGGRLVAGLGDGIYRMDFGQPDKFLLARPSMHVRNRFNDGICDRQGRLWAGTMHREADRDMPPSGALYRLGPQGLDEVETAIGISNGLGWSPDGTTMYFAETHAGIVWAYDYDLETGRTANKRVFAHIPADDGVPDGLTVDAQGRVFVAIWRGARIQIYSPEGGVEGAIGMPVPCPTSCGFGGPGLKTLFVTTARSDQYRPASGQDGLLFAIDMDAPGLPEARHKGTSLTTPPPSP